MVGIETEAREKSHRMIVWGAVRTDLLDYLASRGAPCRGRALRKKIPHRTALVTRCRTQSLARCAHGQQVEILRKTWAGSLGIKTLHNGERENTLCVSLESHCG